MNGLEAKLESGPSGNAAREVTLSKSMMPVTTWYSALTAEKESLLSDLAFTTWPSAVEANKSKYR